MDSKIMLLLITVFTVTINAASPSAVYRSFTGEEDIGDINTVLYEGVDEEPIFQPRFLPFFDDSSAAIGKVVEAFQNPGNKSLQGNLVNVISDVVIKSFGGDETVKKVVGIVKNSQNKTFRRIVMDVAAEVAISKLGNDDETIKVVAEVLKDPGNRTILEKLTNFVASINDTKLKDSGTLKKVAEILQKRGSRTIQENLLNVVFEVGVNKYGDNELFKTVRDVYFNSGNKTIQENLLNLATSVALTKFGNNPIIRLVATSLQNSGNGTFNDKLSAMADAALTASLGPVQAAIVKQGIGVVGQALKVGGSLVGGALADMGGDSVLGKAGRAISNGSLAVGGLMSDFGGGDKGVGAAIEKFGESLKGKNVTVQEALKAVESTMKTNVSKVIEQVVNGEESPVDGTQNETENSSASDQTNSSDSRKTVTEPQSTKSYISPSNKVLTEVSKKASEGNNEPVDVEDPTFIGAEKVLDETRVDKGLVEEQSHISLATAGVSTQEKGVETNYIVTVADEQPEAIAEDDHLNEEGESLDKNVYKGTTFSEHDVIESQTTNKIGGNSQISQGVSGTTLNSFRENSVHLNSANANQDGETTLKNFGGNVESSQIESDSSMRNMNSQGIASPGSSSSGALGSALEAIEAARHALLAGGEALGGALGSVDTSSGNSGVSSGRDERTGGGVMSIEITQVRLNMA